MMILLKIVTPLIERNSGATDDRQNWPSSPPPPPPAVFYIGVVAQAGGQEPGGGQGHGHQAGQQDVVPIVKSFLCSRTFVLLCLSICLPKERWRIFRPQQERAQDKPEVCPSSPPTRWSEEPGGRWWLLHSVSRWYILHNAGTSK